MYVSPKQFFNRGFTFGCFIPLGVIAFLYALSGDWRALAWQVIILLAGCIINYQVCFIDKLKKQYIAVLDELQEQLEVNIALIGYIKEEIKKEEEDAKK
jgi:hypothetical protein